MVEDYTRETIRLLSSIIKKPRLTSELLRRPPFKFIHDVVMELIKATGFAFNLFGVFEKSADSLAASRDAKLAFLNKLISCVYLTAYPSQSAKDISVDVSANKILAGLEPENTNMFLQLLAIAATDLNHNAPDACYRVLKGELVFRNALITPRLSSQQPDLVFSSDALITCISLEDRPMAAVTRFLEEHHPAPKSAEPLLLLSRLLLWHSPSSVLSQASPDFNFTYTF